MVDKDLADGYIDTARQSLAQAKHEMQNPSGNDFHTLSYLRRARLCIEAVEKIFSEGATEGGDKDGKADSSTMA